MTIKLSDSKGKKIKCAYCKHLIFFTKDDVLEENNERFIVCNNEECGKKIKLKRL